MLSDEQRTSLERVVTTFQETLETHVPAQQYLASRGLSHELASTFRLGVVPGDVSGFEQFTGRLSIPYLTPAGVVDVRFRALGDEQPKYMTREGEKGHIYNVPALQVDSDFIGITEGEIDAMVAEGLCEIPCVGIAGAHGWKPFWQRAFQDYAEVFVFCDGDDPGREFGKKVRRDIDHAKVIHLPDGHDINSLYLERGPDEIRKRAGL